MAYTVRNGENLTRIARSLGTTVDELVRLNGITDPDLVFAGQELIVPGEAPAAPAAAAPAAPTSGAASSVEAQRAKGRSTFDAIDANFRGTGQQQIGPRAGDGDKTPAPLPRENPDRSVAATMYDVGDAFPRQGTAAPVTPVERGGPLPSLPPADWQPVPAAGPVPTTQEWTTKRANGSIGAPDGDPTVSETYGSPDLTDSQVSQYQQERGMRTEPAPTPVAAAMTAAAPAAPAAAASARPLRAPTGDLPNIQPAPPWGTEPPPPFAFDVQPAAGVARYDGMTLEQLRAVDRRGMSDEEWAAWNAALGAAIRRERGAGV